MAVTSTTTEVLLALGTAAFLALPLSRRKKKAKPVTERTAPLQLRWKTAPASFQPTPHHWALANALVFNVRNGYAWDSLRLDAPADEVRVTLRQSWGISDRAALLNQLRGLVTNGHRDHLQPLISHYAGLPEQAFAHKLEQLREDKEVSEDERRELLWQIQAARENRDGVQSVNFLAWDMVRFIMLCQNGLLLEFIDETEARDFVLLPSHYLQRNYRSWLDCADQFLRARAFWAGGDPAMTPTQNATHETIALAQRDPHSPWKLLSWEMALPRPQWLFVKALHDMQLLTALTDQERTAANGFELTLDDALRDLHLASQR
jgi:hypothetical protein